MQIGATSQIKNKADKSVLRGYFSKKVTEYQSEEIKLLGLKLMAISKDLGVKESPDHNELKGLVSFLLRNYGNLSIESIEYAFELALIGSLKVDVEHYQSFDKKYISKVLNAYMDHQRSIIKKISDQATTKEREMKERTYKERRQTPEFQEEIYNGLVKYIQDKGELPDVYDWLSVYRHMKRKGLITATTEELKEFMESIKSKAISDLNKAKLEGNYYAERFNKAILSEPNTLKAHWRAQYAKKIFKDFL